jgi:hypothetical protein
MRKMPISALEEFESVFTDPRDLSDETREEEALFDSRGVSAMHWKLAVAHGLQLLSGPCVDYIRRLVAIPLAVQLLPEKLLGFLSSDDTDELGSTLLPFAIGVFARFASFDAELREPELSELVRLMNGRENDETELKWPQMSFRPVGMTHQMVHRLLQSGAIAEQDLTPQEADCLEAILQLIEGESQRQSFVAEIEHLVPRTFEVVDVRFKAARSASAAILKLARNAPPPSAASPAYESA